MNSSQFELAAKNEVLAAERNLGLTHKVTDIVIDSITSFDGYFYGFLSVKNHLYRINYNPNTQNFSVVIYNQTEQYHVPENQAIYTAY